MVADTVVGDNYEASRTATRHLIDHGHRRIAHSGEGRVISTARDRRRGYDDAMAPTGLSEPIHVEYLRSSVEAYRAVQ